MTCKETINQVAYQSEADITQSVLMNCEVLYTVRESPGASSDMQNKPYNGQPPLKNKLVPSVQ